MTCHCPARDCEPCKVCEPCVPTECSSVNAWSSFPIVPVVTSSAGFALGLAWGIVLGAGSAGAAVVFCQRRYAPSSRVQTTRGLVPLRDW